MRKWMAVALSSALLWMDFAAPAAADPVAPSQSWYDLVSSNGQTGVVVDARTGVIHHLRDHLYAAEEPRWQADGTELWLPTTPGGTCFQPQVVYSRDVLRDAYFGLQARGQSQWLNSAPADLDAVVEHLTDHVTVLIGHSGVGKSTLVNALVPGAHRSVGHVNEVTGRGRHTSTSVLALPLPRGGLIIDTPGIRSFGLAHVSADSVIAAFDDLAGGLTECPRGCSHNESECGLDAFVAGDPPLVARLDSLRRLLATDAPEDPQD